MVRARSSIRGRAFSSAASLVHASLPFQLLTSRQRAAPASKPLRARTTACSHGSRGPAHGGPPSPTRATSRPGGGLERNRRTRKGPPPSSMVHSPADSVFSDHAFVLFKVTGPSSDDAPPRVGSPSRFGLASQPPLDGDRQHVLDRRPELAIAALKKSSAADCACRRAPGRSPTRGRRGVRARLSIVPTLDHNAMRFWHRRRLPDIDTGARSTVHFHRLVPFKPLTMIRTRLTASMSPIWHCSGSGLAIAGQKLVRRGQGVPDARPHAEP